MGRPDFEELEVYKLAEILANQIWEIVKKWDYFTKDTMGKQIVRSADSVCANIAEGRGRYNDQYISIPAATTYDKRGHGSAVSLQLIAVGTRHCRVLRLYHSDEERN